MKQGLSLRVSQHLALTPQLQQSIRLLQLSTLELSQEVEQMLDENPFLEVAEEAAPREDFGLGQTDTPVSQETREFESATESIAVGADGTGATGTNDAEPSSEAKLEESWDGDGSVDTAPDDNEWGGDATPRKNNNDDSDVDATELARSQESLQEHLHRQALSLRLSPEGKAALYFLIESLNDDGYLEDSLASLAASLAGDDLEQLEAVEHEFVVALKLLHHMEPAGVGARGLAECLSLQLLDCRNCEETRAAIAMCQQPMELLAKRDVKRLSQLCGFPDTVIKGAIALIGRLDPKPGRRFVNVERNLVVPDVLVVKSGRGFKVSLNSDVMPRLRVHDIYANAIKQNKGQGGAALQQRLQEARWFIKNIQQRFDTILRVSSAIVERQKNFFTHGELAMRPLVLREIADELGLHESTISRVTTAKYMSTPFGTFELKYFFGSALGTETGGNASSTAVRALIKQFVASESLKKPLSDNQISEMLKEQGIECARRTVAKYREALRIAPANLRKSL
ncbi:MAG: RNA polymerase factor sigma-54 [Pseudomonadota bacterium]|uniref:RNA polymerase factor sigma-54 n=1 Tax=Polaromonas sp. TaxID=1869339 RepID=UPI0017F4EB22|nr:RNA polymerase factor sigma-54 [Polaromonas sp.]MBA3594875.1 RNA polymerase factor sigma-54 [Polaromonas sp.]MDQ3271333.1 RNA polymerase factor sigma-54 [Pseudomonadota bacterium]